VAVVIVGGLASSTLLDLLVTPAVFWLFGRPPLSLSNSTKASTLPV
jgi:Cu/Ag efflux pump CusA